MGLKLRFQMSEQIFVLFMGQNLPTWHSKTHIPLSIFHSNSLKFDKKITKNSNHFEPLSLLISIIFLLFFFFLFFLLFAHVAWLVRRVSNFQQFIIYIISNLNNKYKRAYIKFIYHNNKWNQIFNNLLFKLQIIQIINMIKSLLNLCIPINKWTAWNSLEQITL